MKRGIRAGGLAARRGGDRFVEHLVDARLAAAGDVEAQVAARLSEALNAGPGANITFRARPWRATSAAATPSGRRAQT